MHLKAQDNRLLNSDWVAYYTISGQPLLTDPEGKRKWRIIAVMGIDPESGTFRSMTLNEYDTEEIAQEALEALRVLLDGEDDAATNRVGFAR